jgi:phosphomethylpyrimidine synthase
VIEHGMPADLSAGASAKAEALAKAGMAQMSAKLREMGEQVYVEVEKVKESNRVL